MSETPTTDGRDASHIKSKSSLDDTSGVRQRLKFDGVATEMTPDHKRSKGTVKQGEIRESNALPGESRDKKKVRFSSESGDGGACAITLEEWVEDHWSDEHGKGAMYEGLHRKVEPDLDTTATEAALDRLLEYGVVCDIPRDEGAGMKHPTTSWEKICLKPNALDALWPFSRANVVCQHSLWIALMLFIKLLSWMTWWLNRLKST